jgi:hypothetical protein
MEGSSAGRGSHHGGLRYRVGAFTVVRAVLVVT